MAGGDVGREAVYAAELAAFDGTSLEEVVPWHEIDRLATAITAAAWWPHGSIPVVAARRDARSSSARIVAGHAPVVRLARAQATPATVVHEFAHVLAGIDRGHDPTFRRAHVDLASWVFGEPAAGWLVDAYASLQLDLGHRRWPTPTVERLEGDGFSIV